MGSPLVVVLLVAATERPDAIVPALSQATHRPITVVVQETPQPNDDHIADVARKANAKAVVDVTHSSPGRAVIHLHDAEGTVVRQTTADFPERQSPNERARTIGFAVAAMIGGDDPSGAFPPAPPREAASSTSDSPVTPTPDKSGGWDSHVGLEAGGAGLADGRGTTGGGITAGVLVRVASDVELRAGGDARWLADTSEYGFRAGVVWRAVRWTHVSLAARADALVVHDAYDTTQAVADTRTNPNGKVLPSKTSTTTSSTQSSWSPGVAVGPEIEGTTSFFSAYLAPALEIAPRDIDGTKSTVWVTVNAGARFRF